MAVRNESQKGESAFYERIGAASAIKKVGRHSDTGQIDTPHSKRRVTLEDWYYNDFIDEEDKIRTLIDPQGPYSQAAMWALGRAMDDVLITAMQGNAYEGRGTISTIALPDASKLISYTSVGPTVVSRLNIDALRRAKKVLDKAEVDPSIRRYCALGAEQLESLLNETEVTSSDYNTVKALVRGEVDEFMGFTFIRTERIPQADASYVNATGIVDAGSNDATETDADHVLCWASDGVMLSVGRDMKGRIDVRPDKHYLTQVYASMGIGATRLEDVKVLDIACKNSA